MRSIPVVALGLALSAANSALIAQPSTLDAVARAMGGKERILAVRTLVMEGAGETLNFGQNHTPDAETRFAVTSIRNRIDVQNRRWLSEQTREPRFTSAIRTQELRFGFDGSGDPIAYNIGANGVMTRAAAPVAANRAEELLFIPLGFMRAAYATGADVRVGVAPNNLIRLRLTRPGGRYDMLVDRGTYLPTRIEKVTYQPMLGDVTLAVELSDWQDVAGIKVPTHLVQRMADHWTLGDFRFTSVRLDEDVGNLAATDSIRSVTLQSAPAPNVVVDSVAPGVWVVGGQSHHTIAIEQSRGIVLVEAPQNDARTLAAIAQARRLRPDKPLGTLINTHHHFDHAGGLRAAMSQGLTIVTHQGNQEFYEKYVFPGRHVSQRDALAQNPKPLSLVTVSDRHVLADSLRTVEIYPVEGSAHSGSMLVVYLPAERLLIQADLFNPPAPNAAPPAAGFPFAANLVENIQRRGLQVDRVVGIHGRVVPFSELQAAASRAP